ncbi:hypothetical protein ACFVXG_20430 [Kitasatospora sp. NPDC058162]|uniref:hypothetical protein n=1 Tax=Kitasatospora sp. NPDC058162 TaxID=3346362 RepID=UPI0036DAFDF0
MTDDEQTEREHQVLDHNLTWLRRSDPDLNRIFKVGFAEAHRTGRGDELARQLEEYGAVTHRQGRPGDYHQLFVGADQWGLR